MRNLIRWSQIRAQELENLYNSSIDCWDIPWDILDCLIGGKSSIDLDELDFHDFDDTTTFIKNYGYNPENPNDQKAIYAVFIEAICFIEKHLVKPREWGKSIYPPEEILNFDDIRQLILWASSKDPDDEHLKAWACAILRVMHTISHIDSLNRQAHLKFARRHLNKKVQKYLTRDNEGNLWFGNEKHIIPLERVDWKYEKTRTSIILKLLHKKDNVSETIYDLFGVRFVTKRVCDTLVLVNLLHKLNIATFSNCLPARSRNTLVDTKAYKIKVTELLKLNEKDKIDEVEFEKRIIEFNTLTRGDMGHNPHSSSSYRSLQFTCRQMVKFPTPQLAWYSKLIQGIATTDVDERTFDLLQSVRVFIEGWDQMKEMLTTKAFIPFEIQIFDHDSYLDSQSGKSRHDRYKSSQVRAARKRVIGSLIVLARRKSRPRKK